MKAKKKTTKPRRSAGACTAPPAAKTPARRRGRPPNALQWGLRVLASIAHELNKEFGVSVREASRAAAELGREVGWGEGFERNPDIDEESVRQTVYALRKRDPAHLCYEGCWISGPRLQIEQAALKLSKPPQTVVDAIRARELGMGEDRQLAAAHNLGFTPEEIQVMEARNEKQAREAPGRVPGAPFLKRAKK